MTVATQTTKIKYIGDGVVTNWAFNFPVTAKEDIHAIVTDLAGVDRDLVYGTDYTVTLAPNGGIGATVVVNPAVPAGHKLLLYLSTPVTQPVDFKNTGYLDLEQTEKAFDRLTLIIQQVLEAVDRAVKVSITSTTAPDQIMDDINAAQASAAAAAGSAEETLKDFRNIYYGSRSSDPTTRPDGSDMQDGDLYKNTATTTLRVYNAASDIWIDASTVSVSMPISVKAFGASGDGVTDDTPAFAAALLASPYEIYVPFGTYVLNALTINSKRLYGPGTLKWKAAATTSMITLTGDRCVLEGLTFDGNKKNQTLDLTMVRTVAAPNAKLLNNRITNGRYKFFQTDVGGSPGVKAHGNVAYNWGANPSTGANVFDFRSSYFSAIGNHFTRTDIGHNIRTGVYESDPQTPVRGGVIAGNVFYDCLYTGVVVELGTQGLTITGNTFDTIDQGVKMESDLGTQYDVVVSGNTFRNLRIYTAFNLTATRVTFVGNTCLDCAGGIDLGPNSVCSGNTIRNCGNAASSMPSIRVSSSYADCIISDNNVTNSPWRGIQAIGHRMIVKGNRVAASSTINIQVTGADTIVTDNITTGGTYGIAVDTTATNTTVTGNNCSGASTANYSGVSNETALFDATNFGCDGNIVSKTIVSDAISIGRIGTVLSVTVDTEGGAASDSLSTITPSVVASIGAILLLRIATPSRVITVKDGIGNLRLAGDFVMNSSDDRLVLMWAGSTWYEISRSDNG